jgi:hypothetical protein
MLGSFMAAFGGLLGVLAAMLVCSGPVAVLDGEEPVVVVLGLVWGAVIALLAVGLGIAGMRLRRGRGRAMAITMAVIQAPLVFCFCALPSLALLLVTLVLLLVDADVAEALREPSFRL